MAVRAGAPKPDISTVEALKRTLLAAKSIAYSDSASGVYLSTQLFPKLGIAEQIKGKTRKVEADPVEWNARIETLRNVGLEVLDIVKRRDANELWDAGETLDTACENCHRSYWYPKEDAEFYKKLESRAAVPLFPKKP